MKRLAPYLEQGEGIQIEYKRTLSSAYRIARTLTAFANTSGGTILIGVDDDGRTVGIDSEYREMQIIERATDFLIEPTLSVSYEIVRHEGRNVLVVTVPESDEKPHTAVNEHNERTIYVRQRDKSVPTQRLLIDDNEVNQQLLQTTMVKNLLQFLRKNDSVTAARLAKLVNISEYRANKLLHDLTRQGVLLMVDKPRPAHFSLKKDG
ncbi:RNA-binding domain-containing protein [Fibrella sp. WM1]|uniref:RNA-binding domain-containing protein n=1 Tax=Fibrella musci TaxID=3242485 RepID=UPI00351F8C60